MAHYSSKGKSRLTKRTSATPSEWYRVCSQIGRLVNDWSWRSDLAVYGGEDSCEGRAIAGYYAEIAEIEIDVRKAFGEGVSPDFVGDLNEPHAQLPDEPRCFSHTTSPRNKYPSSSCKIEVMSDAKERNGRRPKLATLTTIRPPGSSTRLHSANTSVSISKYST